MIDPFLLRPCGRPLTLAGSAAAALQARLGLCMVLGLAVALSACSTADRTVPTASLPADYHLRHPVVLADARQTLDIFTQGSRDRLDARQVQDVAAFAADWRTHGEGRILAQLPHLAPQAAPGGGPAFAGAATPAARATLVAIKAVLAASGVQGDIEVGDYAVVDPHLAAPIRLSFTKLQARVASRCGEWPQDLGGDAGLNDWNNRSYYNLGCATQQTLSAQVDDPRDLVRPRIDQPTDVQLRTRAIGSLRQGVDPSTNWRQGFSSVGVLGQQ